MDASSERTMEMSPPNRARARFIPMMWNISHKMLKHKKLFLLLLVLCCCYCCCSVVYCYVVVVIVIFVFVVVSVIVVEF
jgi:Flp pilus assembly protein TadB